ncbi:HIG1 domain family member 1A, mitochondrial-like [Hylaeus anthracinus]|uniref:HIG1 domain family member 1A, mitochondrial-like n=1 Tax=Hylaeus anthracinus TaxID=313031 RepID=UPI0023B9691C|nr:HIG1 domain family member 1A, mitochondrial-like [Hylaeus anthracinus]XP_054006960.1 HIG1 domain family member 1A, mitochondrial-like [Hylaeus anthracinus]
MDDSWQSAKEIEIPDEALRLALENNESMKDKLYVAAKRSPFLVAGMLGFTIIAGVGVYKWRTKTIRPSIFLIQLRVAAQGTAIGCLTMGMLYQMYTDLTKPKKNK